MDEEETGVEAVDEEETEEGDLQLWIRRRHGRGSSE